MATKAFPGRIRRQRESSVGDNEGKNCVCRCGGARRRKVEPPLVRTSAVPAFRVLAHVCQLSSSNNKPFLAYHSVTIKTKGSGKRRRTVLPGLVETFNSRCWLFAVEKGIEDCCFFRFYHCPFFRGGSQPLRPSLAPRLRMAWFPLCKLQRSGKSTSPSPLGIHHGIKCRPLTNHTSVPGRRKSNVHSPGCLC